MSYGLSTQQRTKRQIYRRLKASVSYDGIEGVYEKNLKQMSFRSLCFGGATRKTKRSAALFRFIGIAFAVAGIKGAMTMLYCRDARPCVSTTHGLRSQASSEEAIFVRDKVAPPIIFFATAIGLGR